MKTLLVTTPQATMEAKAVRELVPDKITGWQIETLPSGSLGETVNFPDVTVVQLSEETKPAQIKAMIPRLAEFQTHSRQGAFVVFAIKRQSQSTLQKAKTIRKRLQANLAKINEALQEFPNPDRVEVSVVEYAPELAAKLKLIEAKLKAAPPATAPRPSPLDAVTAVTAATADLRVSNGNLSADRVAKLYGVSLSQLADWLGRTRQSVTKTPDADSLQNALGYFERVARLRAAAKSEDAFRKWLRTPNDDLDNESPLDLMRKGEWQVMADQVDDMLTGAPT